MTALTLPADAPPGLAAWLVRVEPDGCRRAARACARDLLASAFGIAPDAAVLGHRGGRPIVEGRPDLWISLSYAGPWLALALARDPVGIDVERVVPHAADPLVAATLPPAPPGTCFFDRWTTHEAMLKALGRGLGEHAHPDDPPVRSWRLAAPPGLSVSLAVAGSSWTQD